MRCDLADYAGTGRQPGGLRLASLRGPRLTINFWTTTLVLLRYPLGLILSYFTVTRIPLVSSTSAPNSKSQARGVTVLPVTLAHKVSPGLQDLQTRARRILAEKNAEKAEENTWIGRMVAAESIGELDGLIKSRAA